MGLIGGAIAMLVGAIIWGAITYITEYQIGYMAIGVGFLVGFAVRRFGKGHSMIFGLSSAALSLIGCILGNFLFYTGAIAREEGVAFMDVFFFLLVTPAAVVELFTLTFEVVDLLFYGLAVYVGFRTALDVPRR
jgi:hypothetical protein